MGCAHEPFCAEVAVVQCVESCGTPAFRQCFSCPTGAYDEALCAPAPASCDPMHVRPAGDCDDATCTDGPNGRCVAGSGESICIYDECTSDADCGDGQRCACDGGVRGAHVCVRSYCDGPDDCGGLPCQPVMDCSGPDDPYFGGVRAFRCQTPTDTCRSDADCTEPGAFCTVPVDSPENPPMGESWVCTPAFCAS